MSFVRRTVAIVALTLGLSAILAVPANAAPTRNDYPYAGQTGDDPWNMMKGECTSFVAWRLNQDGRALTNVSDGQWNGRDWDDRLSSRGWRVSQTATVGSVAQWEAGERTYYAGSTGAWYQAGSRGHVGYVSAVYSNGDILLQDYNRFGTRQFMSTRVPATFVGDFIRKG